MSIPIQGNGLLFLIVFLWRQTEWENNLDPLLALLESVHGGIKGRVLDQDGEVLSEAAIQVQSVHVHDLEDKVEIGVEVEVEVEDRNT